MMSTPLSITMQKNKLLHRLIFSRNIFKYLIAIIFAFSTHTIWGQDVDLELSLTTNNATPALFETIRLTYTLTNTGTAAANNIQVKIGVCNTSANSIDAFNQNNQIVNSAPGPSTSLGSYSIANRRWTIPQLAAGTSASLEVSLFVLTTDEKILLGEVRVVDETDSDSTPFNLFTCTPSEDDEASFIINDDGVTSATPNMTVSNVSFDDSPIYRPGDDFTLTYDVIVEDAAVPATMTRIYLYIQEIGGMERFVELGNINTPAMDANTTQTFNPTISIPTDAAIGNYRLIVKVDETELVGESEEFDNQASPPSVQGVQPKAKINYPDLEITNVLCPSEYPVRGGGATVNYQITLQNNGSQPTFATNLYHYQGEPDRNPFPLPVLGQAEVPALAVGEEVTITLMADLVTEFPGYNSSGEVVYSSLFFSLNPVVTLTGDGFRLAEQDIFCQKYNTDIELSLSADDLTFGLDEIIDYTITVTNNGSETAYNLFTDIQAFLPIGTLENWTTSTNSEVYRFFDINGNPTYHFYIPVLGIGESATADITFKVFRVDTPGQLTETVELTVYSGHLLDSDETNNTDALVFDFDDENNDCTITATIENIRCGDFQGNPIVIADVTVNGTGNVSDNGYLIPLEGGSSTGGNYGETRQLNLDADFVQNGMGGNYAITVIDADDPTCRVDVSEPAPDCTGGGTCTLTATITNMRCTEVLGNPLVTADVTVNATGDVSSNGYTLTVNGDNTNSQTFNYGQTTTVSILNTLVQNVLDGNFAFNVEDLDNSNCSMSFSEPAINCGGNDDLIDLEIELTSDASLVWGNFRKFYVERTIRNNGPDDATDVDLSSSVQAGGNGFFSVIPAGQAPSGRTLFDIDILDTETFYAQVQSVNEQDSDSTPGNGTCCTPNEDDEAVLTFEPCTLSATATLVSCVPGSSPGADELTWSIDVSGSGANGWHAWRGEGGIFLDNPNDDSFLQTITRAELETPTYIQDNINPLCEYEVSFPQNPTCEGGGGDGPDLEVFITSSNNEPGIYMTFTSTITVQNTGDALATNIVLSVPIPEGTVHSNNNTATGEYALFHQEWELGSLGAGESATLDLDLFVLSQDVLTLYAQVTEMTENDADSTPNNGGCCTANEDDEAALVLNGSSNDLPDLVTEFFVEPSATLSDLDFTLRFENTGNATANIFNFKAWLSDDPVLSNNDIQIAQGNSSPNNLAAGDFVDFPSNPSIPMGTAAGTYYIIGEVDVDNDVNESNEGNNRTTSQSFEIIDDNLNFPNLVAFLTASEYTASLGATITIDGFVRNVGNASAGASVSRMYLSEDHLASSDDIVLGSQNTPALDAPDGIDNQSFDVTIPNNLTPGAYHIVYVSDVNNEVEESNEGDFSSAEITILPAQDECEITNVLIQSECVLNEPGTQDDQVTLEIKPQGVHLGSTYTVNGPEVNNEVYGYGDFALLHGFSTSIDAVYTYTVTDNDNPDCTIDFTFNPSSAGANCSGSDGVDLELDLSTTNNNPNIFTKTTLTYTLSNTGTETATNSSVRVGMCSVENGDFLNGFGFINANGVVYSSPSPSTSTGSYNQSSQIWTVPQLAAGQSATLDVTVFLLTAEQRIILGQVETMEQADEDSTPGNLSSCTISEDDEATLNLNGTAGIPDLMLANFTSDGSPATLGEVVPYTFDLKNIGTATASGDFVIGAYLSADSQFSPNDVLVGVVETGNAPVGTQADIPGLITVPTDINPGNYFLLLFADKDNDINESNENNNVNAIPFSIESDCICPDNYDPVCGSNGITYGNACEAECAGIFDYTPGVCGTGDGCGFNKNYTALGGNEFLNLNTTSINVTEGTNAFNINYSGEDDVFDPGERRQIYLSIDQNGDFINQSEEIVSEVYYTQTVNDDNEIELTKFDENGNEVWMRLLEVDYPTITDLSLSRVFEVSNGLVMGGFLVDLSNTPQIRSVIVKTDLNGMNPQLTIIEELPDVFFVNNITEDAAGNLFVWWTTSGNFSLSMVDAAGVSQWVVNVAGDTPSTRWNAVVPSLDGKYVYAVLRDNLRSMVKQINISTGNLDNVFETGVIFSPGSEFSFNNPAGLLSLANGDFIVGGSFTEPPNTVSGFEYGRITETGDLVWSHRIIDAGDLLPISIMADGGFLFSTHPNDNGHQIIKTTSTGEILPECDGGVCTCPENYDPVCGSDGVTYSNACFAECAGIFDYTSGECPMADGIDLEMELIAPATFNIYTTITFQARVFNNGTVNAENVKVSFPLPDGFVHSSNSASHGAYDLFRERWNLGTLKVGETAVLDLNLFALTSDATTVYTQVSEANPMDVDSTPGNGTCCTPNEDDEAAVTIGSSLQGDNDSSSLARPTTNREVEIKTLYPNIAKDELTIFVQSKLPSLNLRVYNLQGHEVLQQKYQHTEGFQRLPLNVSELPTGTYFIRFDGTLGQETVRFVKMRM